MSWATLIGLNDPSVQPGTFADANTLAATRAWWEDVKAGKRSFSFIGQKVSYRFRPDGSVEGRVRDASKDPPEFPPATVAKPQLKQASDPWRRVGVIFAAAFCWR